MSEKALLFKNHGNDAFKKKLYNQAIKHYTESLLLEQNAVVFSNRSQANINLEKWVPAILDANAALSLDSSCAKSYFRRGTAYDKIGCGPLALHDLKKALSLSPDPAIKNLHDRIKNKNHPELSYISPCDMGDECRSDFLKTIEIELEAPLETSVVTEMEEPIVQNDSNDFESINIPASCDSFSQFLGHYASLKDYPTKFAEYFLRIPLTQYSSLFDDMMDFQIFSELLRALVKLLTIKSLAEDDLYESTKNCLIGLSSVERFDMVIMCMSVEDKKNLQVICDHLPKSFREDILKRYTLFNCSSCIHNIGESETRCGPDCVSDYCFQSLYYYDSESYSLSQTGCIVGPSLTAGCRMNQDGQVLCLCQGEQCTTNTSLVDEGVMSTLHAQICKRTTNDGINSVLRWEKPCAGSFCTYRNYTYEYENSTLSSEIASCSTTNDFDIFSPNPIFFYYPNNCVKLKYIGQPNDISCYGNALDYSAITFSSDDLVECYMDYYSPALPYIRTTTFCRGQMCFISSNVRGDVQRGCVSFADGLTGQKMEPQYYRSYTDMEQWLCETNHCNFDLIGAENSWDASKVEYKNISRLQQWNVFYIINQTPSHDLSWFFLPILILISIW